MSQAARVGLGDILVGTLVHLPDCGLSLRSVQIIRIPCLRSGIRLRATVGYLIIFPLWVLCLGSFALDAKRAWHLAPQRTPLDNNINNNIYMCTSIRPVPGRLRFRIV